jgi:hypothetical protein
MQPISWYNFKSGIDVIRLILEVARAARTHAPSRRRRARANEQASEHARTRGQREGALPNTQARGQREGDPKIPCKTKQGLCCATPNRTSAPHLRTAPRHERTVGL